MHIIAAFVFSELMNVSLITKYKLAYAIFVCSNLASPNLPPSNFRVIDTTSTSVTFQWDALSDQQANGVVQQYVITCTERSTSTEVSKVEEALYICM